MEVNYVRLAKLNSYAEIKIMTVAEETEWNNLIKELVESLITELEDATDFMGTFEDAPEEYLGSYERLERKREVLEKAYEIFGGGNEI